MAISGMDAARQAGFSVPGDVSVVGFDDLPLSALVYPQLSSIRQECGAEDSFQTEAAGVAAACCTV